MGFNPSTVIPKVKSNYSHLNIPLLGCEIIKHTTLVAESMFEYVGF